jgi:LysM repeat protein
VNAYWLNVRSGPGVEHAKVTYLVGGQGVNAIGRNADGSWLQLYGSSGESLWVNARYISLAPYNVWSLPVTWGTTPPATGDVYIVKSGDTLYKIAKAYGKSVSELAAHNAIVDPSRIYAGQQIKIPGTYTPPASAKVHIVTYGDTLYSIAKVYGVNMYTLAAYNGLSNIHYLYAGQKLYIPA